MQKTNRKILQIEIVAGDYSGDEQWWAKVNDGGLIRWCTGEGWICPVIEDMSENHKLAVLSAIAMSADDAIAYALGDGRRRYASETALILRFIAGENDDNINGIIMDIKRREREDAEARHNRWKSRYS